MKNISTIMIAIAAGVAVAVMALQPSAAQQADNETDRALQQQQQQQTPATDNQRGTPERREAFRNPGALQRAGQLDERTRGGNIRASELIGMNVHNRQGEAIAKIDDLVIDGQSGKVKYAAVSYGSFLGLGGKLFAVPFEKFQVQQDPDDRDEYVLMLDVTEQQLEGAQGFDDENWPNFADENFTSQVDRRYGVDRRVRDNQNRGANVETREREIRNP